MPGKKQHYAINDDALSVVATYLTSKERANVKRTASFLNEMDISLEKGEVNRLQPQELMEQLIEQLDKKKGSINPLRIRLMIERINQDIQINPGTNLLGKIAEIQERLHIQPNQETWAETILMLAAANGHYEAIAALLKRNDIDVNCQNLWGWTALIYAAKHGHNEAVAALLKRDDINVNLEDSDGDTALMTAAMNGLYKVVTALLTNKDIDVNLENEDGWTALMYAVHNWSLTIVPALLKRNNIDVNYQDNLGVTALMLAVRANHLPLARILLTHPNIDVNLKRENGNTALMMAANYGHNEAGAALLEKDNIDVNLEDKNGRTALTLALMSGHSTIANDLRTRGDRDRDSRLFQSDHKKPAQRVVHVFSWGKNHSRIRLEHRLSQAAWRNQLWVMRKHHQHEFDKQFGLTIVDPELCQHNP